ncbi:MAG TPA: hypothetical protein PKY51_11585 [Fimbriimonadaceae bacterium]|nr:hypothetical protein [Fimbriimonadaceae bacterium]
MRGPEYERRRQKSVVFVGLLLFALILFLIQLWLFVMVLENILAGKTGMVFQAAAASFVLLGVNFWMFAGVSRISKMR